MDTDPHLFVNSFTSGAEPVADEVRASKTMAWLYVLFGVVAGWFTLTFVGSVLRHFGIF